MGITKIELFTDKQNRTAKLLKALAHPARIAIIEYLLDVQTCICGDLVNELPLAQPTISQHLKELKSAGLIQGMVEGASVCYCLNQASIGELYDFLKQIYNTLNAKKLNCC